MLDVPGGTKILTIHAFCQSLLSRFPLEAGVPPEFVVIDERGAGEALAEAVETIVNLPREPSTGRPELAEALAVVARHAPEERFTELMADIAAERGKLRLALADGETVLRRRLCDRLRGRRTMPPATGWSRSSAPRARATKPGCAPLRRRWPTGTTTDRRRGAMLARWCESPARARRDARRLSGSLPDREGRASEKTLITKQAAAKASGDPVAMLRTEAARALRFQEQRAGHGVVEATLALARIGDAVLAGL